jgi:hypothetical protein
MKNAITMAGIAAMMLKAGMALAGAVDVPVYYEVDAKALKDGAPAGTMLTLELHALSDCSGPPVHSESLAIEALKVESPKGVTPKGATKGVKTNRLAALLTGVTLPENSFLKVTGSGITPVGGACQAQTVTSGAPVTDTLAALNCTTDQIIKWDGDEWVCSDHTDNDTLAALNCTANQTVGWNGSAWVCRSAPIVATLSRVAGGPPCCSVADFFQAYSPNVDSSEFCFEGVCEIRLVDVLDHSTCQVTLSGNSGANLVFISTGPDRITLFLNSNLNPGEPFYVNVSCAT